MKLARFTLDTIKFTLQVTALWILYSAATVVGMIYTIQSLGGTL